MFLPELAWNNHDGKYVVFMDPYLALDHHILLVTPFHTETNLAWVVLLRLWVSSFSEVRP